MVKLFKLIVAISLLGSQSSVVVAGVPNSGENIVKDAALAGAAVLGVGVVLGAGLAKSVQLAKGPQGPAKVAGKAVLIAAGIATVAAVGYGMGRLQK